MVNYQKSHIFAATFCAYLQVVSALESPKIALERYKSSKSWKTDLNGAITRSSYEDGVDYVINGPKVVHEVLLSCRAAYPVQWGIMENVKPQRIDGIEVDFSVRYHDQSLEYPEVQEFCSFLRIDNEVDFTGDYICTKVDDSSVSSSTYIFFSGTSEGSKKLLGSNDDLFVATDGQESIVIPCRTSRKDVDVTLEKRGENGNWIKIETDIFDPKRGFTISKNHTDPLQGILKCSTGSTEEVIITVADEMEGEAEVEFPIAELTDASASFKRGLFGYGVQCCSNSTIYPNLVAMPCRNIPDCNIKKLSYMHLLAKVSTETLGVYPVHRFESDTDAGACVETLGYNFATPFIVRCIGDGVNISGQYSSEFELKYQKMNYYPFKDLKSDNYNVNTSMKIMVHRQENVTDKHGESLQETKMFAIGDQPLFIDDKFFIDCCGLTFHHANGRIQRIALKNNDSSFIALSDPVKQTFDDEWEPYMKDLCYEYSPDDEEDFITASENMNEFHCIVPRWYDKTLIVHKVPLNIKVPKEPVLKTADILTDVVYNQNQMGLLLLRCDLEEGAPAPRFIWQKDGYLINRTDQYWSLLPSTDGSSVDVLFMRAVKEIEGEYVCTAKNHKGSSQKYFRVTVIPRSYTDYLVALLIFGGFFVLIACFALRISSIEKPKKRKQHPHVA